MGRKYIEKATREGRVAMLPEWLAEGRTVWIWRENLCDEDGCMDMVSPVCPRNRGASWDSATAMECARRHPVLESMQIYDVRAVFTRLGVAWSVNDSMLVPDDQLRAVFFPNREAALKNRPERAVL